MPWGESNTGSRSRIGVLCGALLDLVYPRHCITCGIRLSERDGACLCRRCYAGLPRIGTEQCPLCGDALGPYAAGRQACGSCREKRSLYFRGTAAACRYESVAREMVHRLKYAGDLRAVGWMAREMTGKLQRTEWFERVELVIPVPLHWTRHAARRFNQSELLAGRVAAEGGKRLCTRVLRRIRRTASQSLLSARERSENIRGAFRAVRPGDIRGKAVLLVDDVMTTCATAAECARTLVTAGARAVYVSTFAR